MQTSKQKMLRSIIISPQSLTCTLLLLLLLTHQITSTKSVHDKSELSIDNEPSETQFLGSDIECNPELLTLFGVTGDKRSKAEKATNSEKAFCRRNKQSCCSTFNIESTNMAFAKGAKALREKFEVVEELFSLFRGPLFMDYITEHKNKAVCQAEVEDMKLELDGQIYGFFDLGFQRYQLMMVENLLMDVVIYVKKNLWFYGDLICLICKPSNQENFIMSNDGSKFEVHTNTCSEMMEEREFERNLLLVFQNYIYKTMKFIECVEDIKIKEEDPDAEDEGEELAFINLNNEAVQNFLDTFDDCWGDQNVEQAQCVEFCKKSLRLYNFPIENLMHNYKVSLDLMYKAMTGNEIAEFYEDIKEEEWKIDHENDPIAFYAQNELWNEYKFDEVKWEYHASKGQNIYKELMSKKYLEFEGVGLKAIGLVVALISLFLIK